MQHAAFPHVQASCPIWLRQIYFKAIARHFGFLVLGVWPKSDMKLCWYSAGFVDQRA